MGRGLHLVFVCPTIRTMIDLPRVPLAHLPTPHQEADAASRRLGVHLRVKRDDLTGSHLSGNKVRKLEYLLADALAEGATDVVTCGGIQSNHCRATALSATPLGLSPVVLLRTTSGRMEDLPVPATGNVLLDLLAGATIHTCDPDGYKDRNAQMEEIAQALRETGRSPYIIPEGGSNALGSMGYVRAIDELAAQCDGLLPSSILVATGSGGTLAGIAMGVRQLGLSITVLGLAVCDDSATFEARVLEISREANERFGAPLLTRADFQVLDEYKGVGYAISQPVELSLIRDVTRSDGLVLDPVYTGKAWLGMESLCRDRPELIGPRPIFVHTGGIFGLMPAGEALSTVLKPDGTG
ncbi:MAG: D-cysteine desulfhydrase family protein [Myxococcota bacterium]|nr:D-cysteine desulfhydrase family protein [Myxococcota bacterium]